MPDFFEEAKNAADEHPDMVDKGVEEAGQFAGQKTGGKYDKQIQDAEQRAEGFLGTDKAGNQDGGQSGN
jgi:hypothetical protein